MGKIIITAVITFFIALGAMLGGSLLGGMGASFCGRPPWDTMIDIAGKMKIWATVSALGGSFGIIEAFESGVFGGHPVQLLQQFIFLCSAFGGAYIGYLLIYHLAGGRLP